MAFTIVCNNSACSHCRYGFSYIQRKLESEGASFTYAAFHKHPSVVNIFNYLLDKIKAESRSFSLFVVCADTVVLVEYITPTKFDAPLPTQPIEAEL